MITVTTAIAFRETNGAEIPSTEIEISISEKVGWKRSEEGVVEQVEALLSLVVVVVEYNLVSALLCHSATVDRKSVV